jgi:ATP-dependent DNA helicase RecQ
VSGDFFLWLRETLRGGSSADPPEGMTTPQGRLVGSLRRLGSGTVGPADLAVLVRHVLRSQDEALGEEGTHTLVVPRSASWPTPGAWRACGIEAEESGEALLRLRARRWLPGWLADERHPPELPAFSGARRRNFRPVPGDPFLGLVDRDRYRCTGQRDAVRAAVTAPRGATLVVNLPTGTGKSLCAHLPAALGAETGRLTLVVVPTVALALDQERSVEGWVPHPSAFVGGSDPDTRARNRGIRERILDGSQRVVFASPEGVRDVLTGPLLEVARRGLLHALVIDEVHVVDQWGDEFRPAFQELAGIRQALLRACPEGAAFPTLLLTATLTASALTTLRALFGSPGPFGVVSAAQLRPEPAYWFSRCPDRRTKQQRVLEALRHLPRPLILYTSVRDETAVWMALLREAGFRRAAAVTGSTDTPSRLRVLEAWARDELDVVVATSAFGMGVDKADVRAVVHACVPESVDRYYQEVGRGGRDGEASLALMLYDHRDLAVARRMGRRTIVSTRRGRERWGRMFHAKEACGAGTFRIPIDVFPSFRREDIDMGGTYNRAWNLRTLTLLQRAGVIELDAEAPPRPDPAREEPGGSDPGFEAAVEWWRGQRVVRILDDAHLVPSTWDARVEPARRRTTEADWKSIRLMGEVLFGERCVGEVLAEAYRIPGDDPAAAGVSVPVAVACGGCPACRRAERPPHAQPMPAAAFPWHPQTSVGPALRDLLSPGGAAVFYPPHGLSSEGQLRRRELVCWLLVQGVRSVVAPAEWEEELRGIDRPSGSAVLFSELGAATPLRLPRVPTMVYFPAGVAVRRDLLPRRADKGESTPRIALLPDTARDPDKPHSLLRDTLRCRSFTLDELRTRLAL